ncbi:unnamed protein product [Schistosoma curassoni]|uniref:Ribonuclease P protein component n=1 Tax=Schistosoma curassoni TaxID=6186 RepID=A0A183K5L3_9TREM|nr:unnamed protein product [Schistosoma curassoni]
MTKCYDERPKFNSVLMNYSKRTKMTERRAYVRFKEHIPKSLTSNKLKAFNSVIARHLLDTGHGVDTLKSVKVINKQSSSNLLKVAEALAIKRLKPDLCIQKKRVINLSLPW